MKELRIEYVKTASLKPYTNNAKLHTDEQIDQICHSIREFGMNDPIAVWKDNEIIEGHGRLMACQKIGMDTVPVIRLDERTDEQRRAYMNVHNQLTMSTGFDLDLLSQELAKINNIDMSLFGFDVQTSSEEDEVVEDEYTEPEDLVQRTKQGDMFQLGEHILMCGDSTTDDVQKLIGGGYSRSMCDGSSIQCGRVEHTGNEDQKRQHARGPVLRVFDIGVPADGESAQTRRRILYLVRQPERGDVTV